MALALVPLAFGPVRVVRLLVMVARGPAFCRASLGRSVGWSDDPSTGEARPSSGCAHHDVVEDFDPQDASGFDEPGRNALVVA